MAGVNRRKPILDVTLDDWNFVLDVNLRGLYFASQAVAKRLVARNAGWGRIIHIASMTSYRGFSDLSLYAVTKSAVVNLTKTQAVEWAGYGIRVNAIAPGWIETPMTAQMSPGRRQWVEAHLPQGAYGQPEDLAGAAVYLASPASDYTTGQTFPVDAGFTAGSPWPALDGRAAPADGRGPQRASGPGSRRAVVARCRWKYRRCSPGATPAAAVGSGPVSAEEIVPWP